MWKVIETKLNTRWVQLLTGVLCMMCISSPQYVWALFTKPLGSQLNVGLAELQITFSILIVLQTFFSPFQGYLVERFGAKRLLSMGFILTGTSWALASRANSIFELYLTYGLLGGLGTGIVYIGVVGQAVKWFPAKRGFAVGMVAAGYGMGAVVTTFPIAHSLVSQGIQETLWWFGCLIGVIGWLLAQALRSPQLSTGKGFPKLNGVSPKEMLKSPVFWLLFLMMSMMSTSGLMVISQMGAIAKDYQVSDAVVFGMAALPLALTIDRLTNGLTRPFFGWVSDVWGRENTMCFAFGLEAVAMLLWILSIDQPLLFVILSGVVFFGWGEIFSLFPSTLTDTFGEKHATTNYGFLYMAQGVGSVIGGPVAAMVHASTGSWISVFVLMISLDLMAACLAIGLLKPIRKKYLINQPRSSSIGS